MKQVAFYAPLKSPDHPVPSGDRAMAQSVLQALAMNNSGLPVVLASQLRCFDGQGDATAQQKIRAQADEEVERLLDSSYGWQAWVTYHNYYKAPDLVGSVVSKRLNIPYLLIEASIAKSRLNGPWSDFAASADSATKSADVIFYLTEKDHKALEEYRPDDQKLVYLPPFLNQSELAPPLRTEKHNNMLLAVGMHRYGDKLESYRILSETLALLRSPDWQLSIVGDGPARAEVESLFAVYGARVEFLGRLDHDAVATAYQQASVFVWPGVNEAFGMVYLEAQAAGLPVVAQDRSGVREVIATAQSLAPTGDSELMAHAIDKLLSDPSHYQKMNQAGVDFVSKKHLLGTAADNLSAQLSTLLA